MNRIKTQRKILSPVAFPHWMFYHYNRCCRPTHADAWDCGLGLFFRGYFPANSYAAETIKTLSLNQNCIMIWWEEVQTKGSHHSYAMARKSCSRFSLQSLSISLKGGSFMAVVYLRKRFFDFSFCLTVFRPHERCASTLDFSGIWHNW